jgi:ABC-type dipeptide/oligopeptide/nickel transport system ATPase component
MAKKFEHLQAPDALRELKGWLVWHWRQKPGSPKPSKMPYYVSGKVRTGTHGSESDRANLVTFEEAKAFAEKNDFAGVGLALMPEFGITALDFDNCVKDGVIDQRVEELTAGTYAELSPSGNGIRAFVKGESPDHKDSTPADGSFGFETFHAKGFVTFTGHVTELTELTGAENTVAPMSDAVVAFCGTRFKRAARVRAECVGAGKPTFGMSPEQITELLNKLPDDLHYEDWRNVGMAVHHETEGEGFDIWHEWSMNSPKYTSQEYCQARWVSFGVNSSADYTTMGTILQMIREAGEETGFETASADEFESLPMPVGGKFKITSDDDFAAQESNLKWLVKGFLPKANLGVLFGESGSGKSFAMLDLSAAICRGLEFWNGHRVSKGRVLYVVAEGVSGFRQRIKAYCHQQAIPRIGMDVIYDITPNLTNVAQITDLISEIRQRESYDLIVMDTFAQVMAGADENNGLDVGNALAQCKRIANRCGAMVLLVHHSGKDASKGSRGHSSIKAACDVEIKVERSNDTRSITTSKMKDGVEGIGYLFKLHTVVLSQDEDGDDITSCIVEFKGAGQAKPETKKKTGANELAFLDALHNVFGLSDEKAGVETARVQAEFCAQFDPSKRQSYKNQAFKRAMETLLEKGAIFEENGSLFLSAENAE